MKHTTPKTTNGGLRKRLEAAALTPKAIERLDPYVATPDPVCQSEMNSLLFAADGRCRVIESADLLRFPTEQIALWANLHNLFQYPTRELVDWLGERITEPALEICAGMSIIGDALGILQTDSGAHAVGTAPEALRERYALVGRPLMRLPPGVALMEANEAVRRHKPRTVVGCWVTQYGVKGHTSVYGVDERKMLKRVNRYLLAGNLATHGAKWILKNKPHGTISAPWLVTRSQHPEQNRLWFWPPSAG